MLKFIIWKKTFLFYIKFIASHLNQYIITEYYETPSNLTLVRRTISYEDSAEKVSSSKQLILVQSLTAMARYDELTIYIKLEVYWVGIINIFNDYFFASLFSFENSPISFENNAPHYLKLSYDIHPTTSLFYLYCRTPFHTRKWSSAIILLVWYILLL